MSSENKLKSSFYYWPSVFGSFNDIFFQNFLSFESGKLQVISKASSVIKSFKPIKSLFQVPSKAVKLLGNFSN